MKAIELAERRWLPDPVIRFGIRHLLQRRLNQEGRYDAARRYQRRAAVLEQLKQSPLALATGEANTQHYEVPTAFFQQVLGPRLKYSACYWPEDVNNLAEAEEAMLQLYAERARLSDGQRILELGCGWGSLTLWLAQNFPCGRITAVSNSASQKLFIDQCTRELGLDNVEVITADVNHFTTALRYDRIVTVEMLEHIRNYERFFQRMAGWLEQDGLAFAHIFCHECLIYPFEIRSGDDWMARYFFTGGMMPSYDTFAEFQHDLKLVQSWRVPGWHYQRTAEAWLQNQDRRRAPMMAVLAAAYGAGQASRWWQRWRMFFMSCAELFGYDDGHEWLVGHYLWSRR